MDIAKPGTIMTDGDGKRFANEAAPYQDLGCAMVASGVRKAFIIADKATLRRYGIGFALPAPYPINDLIRSLYLVTAPTISALAAKLKIDPKAPVASVGRFGEFARTGKGPLLWRRRGVIRQTPW
jgi:hypothetical protein